MGFVQRSLLPGEKIVFHAQLSWMPMLGVLMFGGLSLLLCLVGIAAPPILVLGLAFLFFATLSFFRVLFVLLSSTIVVTNQRLLAKTGFIARSSLEMLLTKLESVEVAQGIGGRLFGYGTVKIHGTGASRVPFRYIKTPMEVRRACVAAADAIQRTVSNLTGPGLTPQPSGSMALFEVKIADPHTNSERWIEVRAANMNQAKELAIATGAIVGDARLKSIS